MNTLLLTVRSTVAGDYIWTLHHGPDGAFISNGTCHQLESVFEEVKAAELDLAQSLI